MKFRDLRKYLIPFRRHENSDSQSAKLIFRPTLEAISYDSEVGTEALIAEGKSNGAKDLPPQNWEGLDEVELKVVKAYQLLIDGATSGHDKDQWGLISKLKSINPRLFPSDGAPDDDYSSQVEGARSEMETMIAKNKSTIQNKLARFCDAKKEYVAFKKENKLNHDLSLPARLRNKAWPWILLSAILLIETLINGLFFAQQVGWFDIIAFIAQAFLIAVVNVGVLGLLIRASWKYLHHIMTILKVWAVLGLIVFSSVAFVFNLGAAHYRDAVSPDYPEQGDNCYRQDEGQEAICLLRDEKANLSEFESYAFLMLGLGFILFSVFKWRDIFPGYPRHAKKQRQFQESQKELQEFVNSLKKDIEKIYSNAKMKLTLSATHEEYLLLLSLIGESQDSNDDKSTYMPSILEDYKLALKILGNIQGKYRDIIGYLNQGADYCAKAIDFYRTANRLAREDITSVPAHWDQKWKPEWYIPEDPIDLGLCSYEYAHSLHNEALRYLEHYLDPYYREAIEKVESLSKDCEITDKSITDSVQNES